MEKQNKRERGVFVDKATLMQREGNGWDGKGREVTK